MLTETRPRPTAPPMRDPLTALARTGWSASATARTRTLLSATETTRLQIAETSDGRDVRLYRHRHPGVGDGMIARFCLSAPLELVLAAAHAAEACGYGGYEQQCPHPAPLLAEHGLTQTDRWESGGRIGSITYSDPARQVRAVMACDHHHRAVAWRIHTPAALWIEMTPLACPHVIAATVRAAAC
jgi:hypothetical protein